jgi:hypothetical protein
MAETKAKKSAKPAAKSGNPVKKGAASEKKIDPVKKAAGAVKKPAKQSALAKELQALIPRLDEEGLAFLIEQAEIHLYNMQVEELNDTISRSKERQAAPKKQSPVSQEISLKASEEGSSYYLVYKGDWIMFSKAEIIQLVNIISAKGTDLEIRERFFNWLKNERRDVLVAMSVKDKFDPRLKTIIALFRKNFKVRYG